ncbi:MAG TPA: LD-carboxypeptidase [Candidatus Limnocylindrales bacterium]|nr:LD-carboxypeptidase [Candidatus Limnocylindrales bacterium]
MPVRAQRKPRPLRQGDTVAVTAPAGFADADCLERGIAILEGWGLRVEPPPPPEPVRYLSGTDSARAAHLSQLFARTDVAAIFCVRGGYGSSRLHGLFDAAVAADHPKIFVGFSDVTLLLGRLVAEAGLVCFHGPMVGADLPRLTALQRERFRSALFDEDGWWDGERLQTWRPGSGRGPLIGGCLSVLVTTLGTPYEVRTDGAVLFLEDVAEKPYRIDRMLTHLRNAGKLDHVAGIVLGSFHDCDDGQGEDILREIALEAVAGLDCPVVVGLDAGHGTGNTVLPMGCMVGIDASVKSAAVSLLESPFERP